MLFRAQTWHCWLSNLISMEEPGSRGIASVRLPFAAVQLKFWRPSSLVLTGPRLSMARHIMASAIIKSKRMWQLEEEHRNPCRCLGNGVILSHNHICLPIVRATWKCSLSILFFFYRSLQFLLGTFRSICLLAVEPSCHGWTILYREVLSRSTSDLLRATWSLSGRQQPVPASLCLFWKLQQRKNISCNSTWASMSIYEHLSSPCTGL